MSDQRSGDTRGNALSARQQRRAKCNDPGADDNERGVVRRLADQSLMWWNDSEDEWQPAVYHNDIRSKLIEAADRGGQNTYDHPRQHGRGDFDETAFHEAQRHWGPARQDWPKITDDILNRLEREDYPSQDYDVDYMFDDGRVVLDADNHPVKDYYDIPVTLSSEVEGWLLEAIWRLDSRIERMDWRARMPTQIEKATGEIHPLYGLSAIGNRSTRFRKGAGLVSWKQRSGSLPINSYIRDRLTKAQQKNEKFFGLSKMEQEEARKPNKGHFLSKAGSRLLSDAERLRRERKTWNPLEFPATHLVKYSIDTSRKRKRRSQSNDQEDLDQNDQGSSLKRLRESASQAMSDNAHSLNGDSRAGLSSTSQSSHDAESSSTFKDSDMPLAQDDEVQGVQFGHGAYTENSIPGPTAEQDGVACEPTTYTYPPLPEISLKEHLGMSSSVSQIGHGRFIGRHQGYHISMVPGRSRKRSPSASDATDDFAIRRPKKQQRKMASSPARRRHTVDSEETAPRVHGSPKQSPNLMSRLSPFESSVWNTQTESVQENPVSPSSPVQSQTIAEVSEEEVIPPDTAPEEPQSPRIDYRFITPTNFIQAASIASALHLTIRDYRGLFPYVDSIPMTSYWANYATQYRQLQASAAEEWRTTYGECPMLNLGHLRAWTGGWDKWDGETFSEGWEAALCEASRGRDVGRVVGSE